jgi:hypothetical protein
MSTIYVFDDEVSALATVATGDRVLIADVSAGVKKYTTVANLQTGILGSASGSTVGFYGVTKVDQGTMTATALTAIATTTISQVATSGKWAFASSTAAQALVTRVTQMQANLEDLMARIDSTGLVAIAGVP